MTEVLKYKTCKVSSINALNPSEYKPENMFSEDEFSSWMSDTKLPHMITLTYDQYIDVYSIEISFQGGFAPKEMIILSLSEENHAFKEAGRQFVDDTNNKQIIQVQIHNTKRIRLVFPSCYDLYNRMVIYSLKVLGKNSEPSNE